MKKTIAQELGFTEFPFEIKDGNGNLIYLEYDDGYWAKWEHDSEGRETYYQNSHSFWAKREYDNKGKEIYFENSDGEIRDNPPQELPKAVAVEKTIAQTLGIKKFPFDIKDETGNLIYIENEDGFWKRWERNKNFKLIYCENSNDFWAKWKYDEQGHEIYFEDSEGQIRYNRSKEQQSSTKIKNMKPTIAQQLGITQFPFEIRDGNGNLLYEEYENGFWAREEFNNEGTQIYHENSSGIIIDNRPQPQPTTPITLQHCLDRGFTVEKVDDPIYKEKHGKEYKICYLKLSKRHMIDYCIDTGICVVYKLDSEGTILKRKYIRYIDDLDLYIWFLASEKVLRKLSKLTNTN
jgi:hypothetical protein